MCEAERKTDAALQAEMRRSPLSIERGTQQKRSKRRTVFLGARTSSKNMRSETAFPESVFKTRPWIAYFIQEAPLERLQRPPCQERLAGRRGIKKEWRHYAPILSKNPEARERI